MPAGEVLSQRALNRALLARQGLLERSDAPAAAMIERLVGMQAQVPSNPYVALWSRLRDFRAEQLSALIAGRAAVRAQTLRATIHLHSARDCLATQPITQAVLRRTFKSQGNFTRTLGGADGEEVAAAGRELLAAAPRTRPELGSLLGPRWPDAEPATLALAVTYNSTLVQAPPRGLWRQPGQARWAPTQDFLGAALDADPSVDALVLRYLAAFGPATVGDVRTWSGLTGLRAVADRLRPQLRTFRDGRGRELLDVHDGPLPDPAKPAPPRFLPEYDNVVLSHEDRSRIFAGHGPGLPFPRGTWIGTLLVDGFYRAFWSLAEGKDGATLTLDRFTPRDDDPPGTLDAIAAEAEGLLAFIAPDAAERRFKPGSAERV